MSSKAPVLIVIAACGLLAVAPLDAQRGGGARGQAPPTPKADPAIDLTGTWTAVITEDWALRMVTPRKGDYTRVPMTPAARRIADVWDPARDEAAGEQCRGYGAPGIMRLPGRLRISWQDDQTLRMESDAGKQMRNFKFASSAMPMLASAPPAGPHTLQGDSVAVWEGGGRGATDGSLKVTTTNLKAGFLRKNGVPYSDNATLTEYYELVTQPDRTPLMVVTIVTTDPVYLRQPFVISSQFKKEANDAKWKPSECSATW